MDPSSDYVGTNRSQNRVEVNQLTIGHHTPDPMDCRKWVIQTILARIVKR